MKLINILNILLSITIILGVFIPVLLTIIDIKRNPHKCPYHETDKEEDQTNN